MIGIVRGRRRRIVRPGGVIGRRAIGRRRGRAVSGVVGRRAAIGVGHGRLPRSRGVIGGVAVLVGGGRALALGVRGAAVLIRRGRLPRSGFVGGGAAVGAGRGRALAGGVRGTAAIGVGRGRLPLGVGRAAAIGARGAPGTLPAGGATLAGAAAPGAAAAGAAAVAARVRPGLGRPASQRRDQQTHEKNRDRAHMSAPPLLGLGRFARRGWRRAILGGPGSGWANGMRFAAAARDEAKAAG